MAKHLVGVLLAALSVPLWSQTTYSSITIPGNNNVQTELISTFPSGSFVTDTSIPYIPASTPSTCGLSGDAPCNFFDGFTGSGQSITIHVSVDSPTDAYTLMNAYDPAGGQQLATVNFISSSGATLTFPLIGGENIRDFYQGNYTNTLSNGVAGADATNIFTCNNPATCLGAGATGDVNTGRQGNYVVDEQHYSFGSTFVGQTLSQIIVTDTYSGSTPILLGLTVGSTPAVAADGIAVVNAASFAPNQPVAPDSIATGFGPDLAPQTASAGSVLSNTLGGTTAIVTDSAGNTQPAPLFYVSPTQVNFQVPAGLASGTAIVAMIQTDGFTSSAAFDIEPVAPGIFAADGQALAYSLVVVDGVPQYTLTVAADPNNPGQFVAAPIALSDSGTYLVLFGTGLRSSPLSQVTVQIGADVIQASYAGPAGVFAGEDQINVLIPASLAGSGDNTVVVTAAGIQSNPVHIAIQ